MIAFTAQRNYGLSLLSVPMLARSEFATDTPRILLTSEVCPSSNRTPYSRETRMDILATQRDDQSFVRPPINTAIAMDESSTRFQRFVQYRKSHARRVVLDVRPTADFRVEHVVGSTSIPVDELRPRLLELPPPFDDAVSIVGNDEDLGRAREFLEAKGWQINKEIKPDVADWGFRGLPTEAGTHSAQVWRANSFLEFCMEYFLLRAVIDGRRLGTVLDLGCGSGRDTVYMAQCLPPGTRVIGVDNHSYALERGGRLARDWLHRGDNVLCDGGKESEGEGEAIDYEHCGRQKLKLPDERLLRSNVLEQGNSNKIREEQRRTCEWLLADLRKTGSLDGHRASVIHGHRFKCEQLLPQLRDEVLLPGGLFIWSTFLDTGKENTVPPWRPSRMLRPGELADIFAGEDFEILVDEHGELPTRGSVVPANFFACRKRC